MRVRFVEFAEAYFTTGNTKVWINPDNVCWVRPQPGSNDKTAVATADNDSPFYVQGSVEDVIAKLTGQSGNFTDQE